jgi:hypothetical protein
MKLGAAMVFFMRYLCCWGVLAFVFYFLPASRAQKKTAPCGGAWRGKAEFRDNIF